MPTCSHLPGLFTTSEGDFQKISCRIQETLGYRLKELQVGKSMYSGIAQCVGAGDCEREKRHCTFPTFYAKN
jgi:hypothetical protein